MAKYLDQTGAQHLAEALMNSTKTVGGQTIWGSGNIEAGGSDSIIKTYIIPGDAEWWENATALSSDDLKIVVLSDETGGIGSTAGKSYSLCNAYVYVSPYKNGTSLLMGGEGASFDFYNCVFCGTFNYSGAAYVQSPYTYIKISGGTYGFTNCILNLAGDGLQSYIFENSTLDFTGYTTINTPASLINFNVISNCEISLTGGFNIVGLDFRSCNITNSISAGYDSIVSGTYRGCRFDSSTTISSPSSTVSKKVEYANCQIEMTTGPVNRLFNVQRCNVNSTIAPVCHPWTTPSVMVDDTADGGFNNVR